MSNDAQLSSQILEKDQDVSSARDEGAPAPARQRLRLVSKTPRGAAGPSAAADGSTSEAASQADKQMLALAEVIDGWADTLPCWDAQVTEPWFVFVERAYQAETALAAKLRALPTCRLTMCPIRVQVSLTLAGISVSTEQGGLHGALRRWAREARARVAG